MENADIIDLIQQSIILMIQLSTPVMLVGLFVGVAIALLQALTQIQEMTLVFVPKIIAIYASILLLLPAMVASLISFMEFLADKIVGIS